jgi:sulfofructose kinase
MTIADSDHPFQFDVLGLGVTAVDDLLHVPAYPPADVKVRVRGRERYLGGLTAAALLAVARLGYKAAYAGVLGDDESSRYVLEGFQRHGVDVRHVVHRPGTRPVLSTIVLGDDGHTRNIFYDNRNAFGAHPDLPPAEVIRASRVLFVDHYGIAGMIRAASIAREAGLPVVADFEHEDNPRFPELLALVDHLIIPDDFAQTLSGESDPATAVERLWTPAPKNIVVTCGVNGAYYTDPSGTDVQYQPAFTVEVVDSNGCGDVFHGAYAAALSTEMPLPERVRFAAAAAALKATQPGGAMGTPDKTTVEAFLKDQIE